MVTPLFLLLIAPLLLCWGSFLNVVAYRLVHPVPFLHPRSICPHCKKIIAWYDNIPVLSWLVLRGKCRTCAQPISVLYPFIEILTVVVMSALFYFVKPLYWPSYFLFFSALIVTIRTDFETMLISRRVTLFLIPTAVIWSAVELLPITPLHSIFGALLGYGMLFVADKLFYFFAKRRGIGLGDLELLAFIGAFTGIVGCWVSLMVGSLLGTFGSLIYATATGRKMDMLIPFGPFLAVGAFMYVLFQQQILRFLLF